MTAAAYAPAAPELGADGRLIAVYARLSKDPRTGELGENVDWQETEIRRRFITPAIPEAQIRVFTDNDVSASRYSRKGREGFRAMVAEMAAGNVGAVLFTASDRLFRQPRELEDFMPVADAHRVEMRGVFAGVLDFTTGNGRFAARQAGNVAALESDIKSDRARNMHNRKAEQGKFGGGKRRYGYEPGMTAIREGEAKYVRELATRIIAGETVGAICR